MNSEFSFSYRQIIYIVLSTMILVGISFALNYYYLLFLPAFFFIALGFFFKPDLFFYFLAFITPLSINPADAELGKLSLSIPSEPIAAILVVFFFLLLVTTNKVDRKFLLHPISIIIYIYFIWMGICTMTSEEKLVSIKFVIAKTWFIVPCYFLAGVFFQENKSIIRYMFLFVLGITLVSTYNVIHLSQYGFEDKPSQWTMQPFFKDHAILGAVVAINIPLCLGLIKLTGKNFINRTSLIFFLLILVFCIIVTYSRAAWVSVVPALLLYLIFVFRIRFKWIMLVVFIGLGYAIVHMDSIIMNMEQNKVAGSDDIEKNAESISNISTDPSNLERINRWACAIEMWKDRPYVGWGPGTYMFEYAPFQLRRNYTEISTNFGDVGNAHSEYLGPLAETGFPGLLIFICLLFATFYFAFKAHWNTDSKINKILICTAACGLVTYFTHGFLNNFLDTDKASNIFWPLIAVIVAMDVRNQNEKEAESI
jgi:putative inorganic carbon (HCO3(-)) transporter